MAPPDGLEATADLAATLAEAELVLIATPSTAAEAAATALAEADPKGAAPLLICAKGFAQAGERRVRAPSDAGQGRQRSNRRSATPIRPFTTSPKAESRATPAIN